MSAQHTPELLAAAQIAVDLLEHPSDHKTPQQWAEMAAAVLRAAIAKANARIVAAPDLLDALEGFVRDLERGPWGLDGPPITHPQHARFNHARAAIAKARGTP